MEQILQLISISKMFSLLDGFLGYNGVIVVEPNQLKTTFRTKWGTYAYIIMPFGLVNAGATFQMATDIYFKGLIGQSKLVYLNDVMAYSKKREDHPRHLKKIFERCKKYGILVNMKKIFFVVS